MAAALPSQSVFASLSHPSLHLQDPHSFHTISLSPPTRYGKLYPLPGKNHLPVLAKRPFLSWQIKRDCFCYAAATRSENVNTFERGQDDPSQPSERQPKPKTGNDGAGLERLEVDVVIVGAGIIGLSIASELLSKTNFTVAIVDAAKPCAGATGAGQGYIWLGHKQPGTVNWPLAKRSKQLWEEFVDRIRLSGLDPLVTIGWRNTGSLIFGSTPSAARSLQKRVETLSAAGVQAEFFTAASIAKVEPELQVGDDGSAAFIAGDSQIDAQLAVSYLEEGNRQFATSGHLKELYHDPVVNLIWSQQDQRVIGVQTSRRIIYSKQAVVMAAGAWSGDLMTKFFEKCLMPFFLPVRPRKGHLLVLEGLPQLRLRHAVMELEYGSEQGSSPYGIAMTATMGTGDSVLLGSSRQFTGFDCHLETEVLDHIFQRASKFLRSLENTSLSEALRGGAVRTGLRPYVPDGWPMIGPVPGLQGLILATGHEGSGLCLALGTAEMVANLILDAHNGVDPSPFSPTGRLISPLSEERPVH